VSFVSCSSLSSLRFQISPHPSPTTQSPENTIHTHNYGTCSTAEPVPRPSVPPVGKLGVLGRTSGLSYCLPRHHNRACRVHLEEPFNLKVPFDTKPTYFSSRTNLRKCLLRLHQLFTIIHRKCVCSFLYVTTTQKEDNKLTVNSFLK
jgi:hypothetical protein